ncbi:30S ribosomal protein S2 [Mycoplasma crocodyli]|uniref:Small ribosomal subunit protein uS2 n=1 Tax=Mycoplasma crocodyli (strain ATCC 51981 / MP145) TaxID=512564 RepID=D5E5E7_MYCCM|nr:30S ribosomal protein S2 [Mycoplasma crocodyli]ADE19558.1 30S ribosomal protein S2 [Mycoplasma crocodyli MP145]
MSENTQKETVKKETVAKEVVARDAKNPIVSKDKLLEAGAYFGHKVHQWNPKMKEYIVPGKTNRGAHIIDISKTQKYLEFAYSLINKFAAKKASFIFVGTKKQAHAAIKEAAERTQSFYVTERWLGGTLTNNQTIMSRVKAMEILEAKAASGFKGYTKKEAIIFQKELDKLHKNLEGIRNMKHIPQVMIVADPNEDEIAVKEARKKGIKVIGILDSNANPDSVDFGIPANDDSSKSISLIITILADAIVKARGGKELFAYQPDELIVLPEYQPPVNAKPKRVFPNGRRPFNKNFSKDSNREGFEKREFKKPTEVKEN